jgi:hypothetical protein
MHLYLVARAIARDNAINLPQSGPNTRTEQKTLLVGAEIVGQLVVHGLLKLARLRVAVGRVGELLSGKCDQNAKYDNAYLARKGAPSVQRFRHVDLHANALLRLRQ